MTIVAQDANVPPMPLPRVVDNPAMRLGHAKPATTLNVYAHVLPAADRQAVELFAAAISGARAAEVNPPTR